MTTSNFTEESTSRSIMVDDLPEEYHEVGSGYPLLMLHSYAPGTTGWISFS